MTLDELKAALSRMNDEERIAFQKSFGGGPNNFNGRLEDITFWLNDFVRNPTREHLYAHALGFPTEQDRVNAAQLSAAAAACDAAKYARESNEHAKESNKISADANRLAMESNDIAERANRLACVSLVVAIIAAIVAVFAIFTPPYTGGSVGTP